MTLDAESRYTIHHIASTAALSVGIKYFLEPYYYLLNCTCNSFLLSPLTYADSYENRAPESQLKLRTVGI